jgi:hypothetical protein
MRLGPVGCTAWSSAFGDLNHQPGPEYEYDAEYVRRGQGNLNWGNAEKAEMLRPACRIHLYC